MSQARETAGDEDVIVYLPVQSAQADQEAVLELRPTDQGQTAMPTYTSLEQLVECCGPYQPWIAMPARTVPMLMDRSGADGLLWDPPLGEEQRHGPEEFDEADDAALRTAIDDDVIRKESERGD